MIGQCKIYTLNFLWIFSFLFYEIRRTCSPPRVCVFLCTNSGSQRSIVIGRGIAILPLPAFSPFLSCALAHTRALCKRFLNRRTRLCNELQAQRRTNPPWPVSRSSACRPSCKKTRNVPIAPDKRIKSNTPTVSALLPLDSGLS